MILGRDGASWEAPPRPEQCYTQWTFFFSDGKIERCPEIGTVLEHIGCVHEHVRDVWACDEHHQTTLRGLHGCAKCRESKEPHRCIMYLGPDHYRSLNATDNDSD